MDHRAGEGAGHAQPFRAQRFTHEMRICAADTRGDRAQKIHVQTRWRKFENFLEGIFGKRADDGRLERGGGG